MGFKTVLKSAWDSFHWGSGPNAPAAADEAPLSVVAASTSGRQLTPVEAYCESIAVTAAVNAIATNLSKAQVRIFTQTGMEVVGGPLAELLRHPSREMKLTQRRLLREIVSWLNIKGEFFLNLVGDGDKPTEIVPLNPTRVLVQNPAKVVNTRADVVQWRYDWADGHQEFIRDDRMVFERLFNPNAYSIRGLSPLVTGSVLVSAGVAAERYNKDFFDNGAIPSHLIILPEGTSRRDREAFKREYVSEYGHRNSNAHKVAVVAGSKDVKFQSLEEPFQDGAFLEMLKRIDLKVGQLYRVPAINMGIYDKTRFDTANEERKLFLEETLEPQAELIAEALQQQLVDPFFQYVPHVTGRPVKEFSKNVQKAFEKAEGERPRRGGVILVIDTDALPIKHEVQAAKTEQALKLREAYDISARKAEEWMGLDFGEDDEVRDEIFVPNNRICITDPKLNESLIPGVKPGGPADGSGDAAGGNADNKPTEPAKPSKMADRIALAMTAAEMDGHSPDAIKSAKRFLHKVRRLTFDSIDAGGMWSLADGYALAGDDALKPLVRRVRHALRKLDLDAAKAWLNEADAKALL